MSASDAPWLAACPAALRPTLMAYIAGELPAAVALMHLMMEGPASRSVEAVLARALGATESGAAGAIEAARLRDLLALCRRNPGAAATVASVLEIMAHDAPMGSESDGIAYWRRGFDRAVRMSPEASVALYSLGNPELLSAATAELVARLTEWGVVRPARRVLDVGCGSGRMEAALAPHVASIVGIDIAPAMLEIARRRCAPHRNAHFVQVSGHDLAAIADARTDLVIAIDAFPYLVQTGIALVERHLRDLARVLTPDGDLVIANFSYRGDSARDRADVAFLGRAAGFHVLRNGTRDLASWDGAMFHLVRAR